MPNPNILFQNAPTPSLGANFRDAAGNQEVFNQFQQQPMRNRLLDAQVQGAEIGNQNQLINQQSAKQKMQRSTALSQIQDMAADAYQMIPLIESDDPFAVFDALEKRAQKIQQRGGDPSDTIDFMNRLKNGDINKEQAISELSTIVGKAQQLGVFGQGMRSEVAAPSSVREYEFFNSLSDEDQEKFLSMKRANPQIKINDVPMVGNQLSPTAKAYTDSDQPVSQAEQQEIITGQKATQEATKEAATTAIKESKAAFDKIQPIKKSIANYDEAIRLIDEGAGTGAIESRFPSFKQASVELDNLQGRLGLDVIGNTTFGALSEAELKFALSTALPEKLDGPALKEWIQRKKDAQEKLLSYTEQAATYLGTPGNTIAGWLEVQKEGQQQKASRLDELRSKAGF